MFPTLWRSLHNTFDQLAIRNPNTTSKPHIPRTKLNLEQLEARIVLDDSYTVPIHVSVPAATLDRTQAMTFSGVFVDANDTINISVSGQASGGPGFPYYDANGVPGRPTSGNPFPTITGPSANIYSLVANITPSCATVTNQWFTVGTRLTRTADHSGQLVFVLNDALYRSDSIWAQAYADNTGHFTADITIQRNSPHLIVVNSTSDAQDFDPTDGDLDTDPDTPGCQVTLRAALQQANTYADQDTIAFDIPGAGPHIISIGSAGLGPLPSITNPLSILRNTDINVNGTSLDREQRGLTISATNVTVDSLTLADFSGGALLITASNDVHILHTIMFHNHFDLDNAADGAGIKINNSHNVSIDSCTFEDNVASRGYGGGIAAFDTSGLAIKDSDFTLNKAISPDYLATSSTGGGGGAIFTRTCTTVRIMHSTVHGNSAAYGGGIATQGTLAASADVTMVDNDIYDNQAIYAGGGIAFVGSYDDYFALWAMNKGATSGFALRGVPGGVNSIVTHNKIHYNRTDGFFSIKESRGGGIYNGGLRSYLILKQNTIANNHSVGDGGGICTFNFATTIANGNTVSENVADDDGGGVDQGTASTGRWQADNAIEYNVAGGNGAGEVSIFAMQRLLRAAATLLLVMLPQETAGGLQLYRLMMGRR
jgi:hypothetical protein